MKFFKVTVISDSDVLSDRYTRHLAYCESFSVVAALNRPSTQEEAIEELFRLALNANPENLSIRPLGLDEARDMVFEVEVKE